MISLSRATGPGFAALADAVPRALKKRLAALLGREQLPGKAELAALKPATRALMAGLAAWIGFVGVVTFAAVLSLQFSRFNLSTWLGVQGPMTRSSQARSTSAFDNIVQRPLFARTRQAVVAAVPVLAASPPPAMLDQNITLKGVFLNEGVAKAFLLTARNPVGIWVKIDGEINGWRIVGIQPNQIVLDGQNQRLVVPLNVSGGR